MSDDQKIPIRPREENLKKQWAGLKEEVPVNTSQYSFDSLEREEKFVEAQFPTKEEKTEYRKYRNEWYRRAKEFDPGEAPLAVCIELVSTCNLGCPMCYTITEEYQNTVLGSQRMLPWNVVTSAIDECAELGVPSILFSWRGESTLYRSNWMGKQYTFTDALAYAREKGILEITSLTHGQSMDKEMAEAIVDAEPSWISVSIDGLNETYNKIRTPPSKRNNKTFDAFNLVASNIERLVSIRNSQGKTRPQIRVNSIYPAIARDPQKYREFMEKIGVGWVTINELLDFREDELPDDAIIESWACQYPFQRLTISANGIMLPCTGAHNDESGLVLGRYVGTPPKMTRNVDGSFATVEVEERTLYQAWHGEKLQNIRWLHKNLRRTEITPGCRNCRHGAIKHGVDWVPEDWNMDTMEWEGGTWRE